MGLGVDTDLHFTQHHRTYRKGNCRGIDDGKREDDGAEDVVAELNIEGAPAGGRDRPGVKEDVDVRGGNEGNKV
jgi:hypothetical protein